MEELHRWPSLVPVFVWRGSAIGRIIQSCASPGLANRLALRGSRPYGSAAWTVFWSASWVRSGNVAALPAVPRKSCELLKALGGRLAQ